jgi:phage terminase large subunit-like protein
MTELGMPLQPFSQSMMNFTIPTKTLERIIKMGNVTIDDNEMTRWCFANVVLKVDWNDNCRPIKEENQQKIDGVIAMLQALGGYLTVNHYDNEIIAFQVENNLK